MLKKTISLFLAAVMLLTALSGCRVNSGNAEKTVQTSSEKNTSPTAAASETAAETSVSSSGGQDNAEISYELQNDPAAGLEQLVSRSLVLSLDCDSAFVCGEYSDAPAPFIYKEQTYIPVGFTAASLGGIFNWNEQTSTAEITYKNESFSVTAGDKSIDELRSSGEVVEYLSAGASQLSDAIGGNGDVFVPAKGLCDKLGTCFSERDGILLIGDNVDPETGFSDEELLMLNSMRVQLLSRKLGRDEIMSILYDDKEEPSYMQRRINAAKVFSSPASIMPFASEKDKLYTNSGGLYIENVSFSRIENDKKNFLLEMTVYNNMYTYGIAEIYDKEGNLVNICPIEPFGGRSDNVIVAIKDFGKIFYDSATAIVNKDWAYLDYRSSYNSEKNEISIKVPYDGFVIVTCNNDVSDLVAAYNAVHTALTFLISGGQIFGSISKDEENDFIKDVAKDYLNSIAEDSEKILKLAAKFRALIGNWLEDPFSRKTLSGFVTAVGELFDEEDIALKTFINAAIKPSWNILDSGIKNWLDKGGIGIGAAFKSLTGIIAAENVICTLISLSSSGNSKEVIFRLVTSNFNNSDNINNGGFACYDEESGAWFCRGKKISGDKYELLRKDADGKTTVIAKNAAFCPNINVSGGYVYYGEQNEPMIGGEAIRRVRPDGTDNTVIYDSCAGSFYVTGKYIFLTYDHSFAHSRTLARIDLDGGNEVTITDACIDCVYCDEDTVYYIENVYHMVEVYGSDWNTGHFGLYAYDIESGESRLIWNDLDDSNALSFTVAGDRIYICDPDVFSEGGETKRSVELWSVKKDGSDAKLIAKENYCDDYAINPIYDGFSTVYYCFYKFRSTLKKLTAYNIETGKRTEVGNLESGEDVYFGQGALFAFDGDTARKITAG